MEDDQQDTLDTEAQEEQDDSAENESEDQSEEQDAEGSEAEDSEQPKLYAGKFKSPEDMEKAYLEIQKFTGGRKELEAKAAAFDREVRRANSQAAARSQIPMPQLQQYVAQDGTIDVAGYDAHMVAWTTQQSSVLGTVANKSSQEAIDKQRAYQDFPYLYEDEEAAQMVIDRYEAGRSSSIYDAAVAVNKLLTRGSDQTVKKAEVEARHELSKKSRGNTERPNAKSTRDNGEMTEAKFSRLSQEDKQTYIKEQFKKGLWGQKTR